MLINCEFLNGFKSLSSRRAWIEIQRNPRFYQGTAVALLTESVDRNAIVHDTPHFYDVALLTESVDRNEPRKGMYGYSSGRSPHGERG